MTDQSKMLNVQVSERDHIQGSETALVTLVEYGDFECSHCGAAYLVVEALREELEDRMRFVFRHFPLQQAHPNAENAAEAAEAAHAKGHFWEMHKILFSNQDALTFPDLADYASQLGMDSNWFKQALADRSYQKHVREDFMGGVHSGVNGTPTFFLNGTRYDGAFDLNSLRSAVEKMISSAL